MPFVPDQQAAAPKGRFVPDAAPAPVTSVSDAARLGLQGGAGELLGQAKEKVGVLENAASMGAGALAQIPAGLAGIGQGAKNWYEGKEGADNMPAGDRVRQVEGALTPQPYTDTGKAIQTGVGSIGEAATRLLPDNPAAQTFIPAGAQALATVLPVARAALAGRAALAATGEASAARAAAPPQSALEEVQRNGYQITPSSVPVRNPSVLPKDVPGHLRESLTSSPQQTEQIIRNNAVTNTGHIGSDFGVPNATKLLPEHYSAAKVAPGKFYDAAGEAVGTVGEKAPVLSETHGIIRKALADNTSEAPNVMVKQQLERINTGLEHGEYKGPQLVKDISYLREQNNSTARMVADQLEEEMGNQLKDQPKVLGDFRNARTEFAKIYDAQDATTGGQIDAGVYARLARRRPDLLTGGAAKVAQAGQEIPHLTRLPNPMSDKSPVGSTILGTVRNIVAPRIAKLPGMNILDPKLQRRIGQSAPPPGPLPSPTRLIGPPGAKPTGGLPPELGAALSPTPGGPVIKPLQRGNKLPQATSLRMTQQLLDQIRLRGGQLPGTLEP